ncbi:MAG: hypothetical protein WC285_03210 [Candidatus Gracilibacteria bacterium]|jgi:beta-glucosidase-like glycosyl hydrolase
MADNTQTNSSTSTSTTAVNPPADIVVDKNKTAEQYLKEAEAKYIVPALIRQKFPDLIKLIYETESMNAEEREYWLQIMPIMTEEQVTKFREILVNEKTELSKLDQEYQTEMSKLNKNRPQAIDEKALKEKMTQIKTAEASEEGKEKKDEENLLNQLDNL